MLDASTNVLVALVKAHGARECVIKTTNYHDLQHVRPAMDIYRTVSELSPHVVQFWAAWYDDNSFSVLMEWCEGGNLRAAMCSKKLDEQSVQNFIVRPLLQVLALMQSMVR